MGLETGVVSPDDLVLTNPINTDPRSEGDDHIRLTKVALLHAWTSAKRTSDMFKCRAQTTPDMTLSIEAGAIFSGVTLTEKGAQTVSAITAPVSDPRIDRIVVDKATGNYTTVGGAEAGSPTAPAIPTGKAPVAQIALVVSQTSIVEGDITDERVLTGFTTALTVPDGGTGAVTFTEGGLLLGSAAGAITAMTRLAKGSLAAGATSGDAIPRTVGANGTLLTADSAEATGMKWAAAAASGFPSGTLMLFQQTAAPTGWTKGSTHNNKALRVVTGSASSAGASAFTSVFGAGKATGATAPGGPSHAHTYTVANAAGASWGSGSSAGTISGSSTGASGGGSSHTHTRPTMDIQYVDLIIASKDA